MQTLAMQNRYAVGTWMARRMRYNLPAGSGIQTNRRHGMHMRWVSDTCGNSWGDRVGDTATYIVPRRDLATVALRMQKKKTVTLVVRRRDADYNYGKYRIERLEPRDAISYTAHLCRVKTGRFATAARQQTSDSGSDCSSTATSGDSSGDDSTWMADSDDSNDTWISLSDSDSSSSDGRSVYVVERILGHRLRGKSWTFHVAWRRHRERTWEPLKNLVHRGRVNASLWAYCRSHSLRRALKAAKALMIDD